MLIGVTGKPSSGKSTFFSAATLIDVPISPRPFTTIEPNKGATYVRVPCPCKELGTKCDPQNSKCEGGTRLIPISMVDLAGLVPGAHLGKGLGNQFLDDVRTADALIQVVDASGTTDSEGNPCEKYDPIEEVIFLEEEIVQWMAGIMKRGWAKVKGRDSEALATLLTGLKISKEDIEKTAERQSLSTSSISWSDEEIVAFSREIRKSAMPIVIAANKIDLPGAEENYKRLEEKFEDKVVISTYADGELALRRAARKGIVKYTPGDPSFEIIGASDNLKAALEKIRKTVVENKGTGVQQLINEVVFNQLKLIVVYPVSDEHKYTDNFGKVLPDAVLVPEGTTAVGLAGKIHTDLAKAFLFAIDARKKMRIGRDHPLQNGDIIKIVAAK
jgi:hypothetical protein